MSLFKFRIKENIQNIYDFRSFRFADKDSSFRIYSVMRYNRNFLFNSMHKDWYICESGQRKLHATKLALDFYNGDQDVLDRCTFLAHPIPQNDDKLKNCKNVLGPVEHPAINGQPLPNPPHLVSKTPPPPHALPSCIPVCPVTGPAPSTSIVSETPTVTSMRKFRFSQFNKICSPTMVLQ